MSFAGRTRNEIRDTLLGYWQAEYAAATPPQTLLVAPGSDAYLLASALAAILEALEAQAEANARNLMPDTADKASLDRFGAVYDIPRLGGSHAKFNVTVTSPTTSSGLKPIAAGTRMTASDGTLYVANVSSATFVSYSATIELVAVNDGAAGTPAVGATLTFVATPTDFNSTGTVSSVTTNGTDQEQDGPYSLRIIQFLRERPASGNRADWRAWAETYTGTEIAAAYVYPLREPPASAPGAGTEGIPGCVTIVAVGPAQGDSPINTRVVPSDDSSTRTEGGRLSRIVDYIEGDRDAHGITINDGAQLRPVTMSPESYTIEAISTSAMDVTGTIVCSAATRPTWSGTMTIHATSDATHVVVTGDETARNNVTALVKTTTDMNRGGYVQVSLGTGTYNGGTNRTTWVVSNMGGAPVASSTVHPAPGNWSAIRAAIFDYFDNLAPGDAVTDPRRWPSEDSGARSTVYVSALVSVIMSVSGVLSVTLSDPAIDRTPDAKQVMTLATLTLAAS